MQQTQNQITRNEKLGEDIYRLTIEAPEIAASVRPGQFVMVKAGHGFDPLLRRPFSIHRVLEDKIQILFKRLGKGTALLAAMPPNATVDLLGPLGNGFKWQKGMNCLIGGGMGIAPLLFLAQEMVKEEIKPQIMLGARNKSELSGILPDFESLECPVTYATDDGSLGRHGFIIEYLEPILNPHGPWQVFTCGPHPMMRAVAACCRTNAWPCQVSMETMMACGISACLGCTIASNSTNQKGGKYLHVCQDGPVFFENQIQW